MKSLIILLMILLYGNTCIQSQIRITNATVAVKENNNSTQNNVYTYRIGTHTEILKTLLYYTDTNGVVRNADGVTSVFNNNYNNEVDANDAQQMANWDEDVAIKRNGYYLSIESRKLAEANDTIFLAIARLKTQTYTWKFVPKNFNAPNLQVQLKDNFTNTLTNISITDTTVVNFTTTTNAASKAENRFSILFKSNGVLPVTIRQLEAFTKNNGVQVQWQASNEINIDTYEVEKSTNALNFGFMQAVPAVKANQYQCFDAQPTAGNMYYRIKVIEKSGYSYYSSIVKVAIASYKMAVSVYPNPAVGNQLAVLLNNLPKGTYQLNILNTTGLLVYSKNIHHLGGSANHQIQLNNALQTSGMYQLILVKDDIKLIQSYIKQ